MFKVGDRVKVVNPYDCRKFFSVGAGGIVTLVEDTLVQVKFDSGNYDADGGGEWWAAVNRLELVHKADHATSRSNDPATSKGKRRINKYEQVVLNSLGSVYFDKRLGATGKEIAEHTGHPLNCITPRFAPLRRKGKIKPMEVPVEWGEIRFIPKYVKRDKQIVWVLA